MDLLQEYKELYYKEIEYSERLNSKISTCVTFLTIIGSGVILIWSQVKNFAPSWYTNVYIFESCLSTSLFLFCAFKLIRTYTGYSVNYFPIRDMAKSIQKTYLDNKTEPYGDEEIENVIASQMAERFINDAVYNRDVNITKNKRHKNLIQWIMVAFAAILITYATNIAIEFYEVKTIPQPPQHIYIERGEENVY